MGKCEMMCSEGHVKYTGWVGLLNFKLVLFAIGLSYQPVYIYNII